MKEQRQRGVERDAESFGCVLERVDVSRKFTRGCRGSRYWTAIYLTSAMSTVGVTHSEREILEAGVCESCHRGKEAIHVQMQNRPCRLPVCT